MKKEPKHPKKGDVIYVPSSYFLDHGRDDFRGGKATVTSVKMEISGGQSEPFVSVKEKPGSSYNWSYLADLQEDLKKEFGDTWAYPEPDNDPQFNRG